MTTQFSFQARLIIGDQLIPIATEVTTGASNAEGGVQNGFLFTIDYQPGDAPIVIDLGSIIGFIEDKLGAGAGSLSRNSNLPLLEHAFPSITGPGSFTYASTLAIAVRAFTINTSTDKKLFSISVDVGSSDPSTGLIPLPSEFASWLQIQNLAISFTATSGNG